MIDPQHEAVLRRHVAAESARRLEETLATLAEDCLFDDRTLHRLFHGHEGATTYYRIWWDAFDNTVQVDEVRWTTDGGVLGEVRFQGVHRGHFLGIAPTGRAVDLPIVLLVTGFRGGRMAGERIYWDVGTLLSQLGVTSLDGVRLGATI
jgi:steroid delta-isomerase-like uncharacterized protein